VPIKGKSVLQRSLEAFLFLDGLAGLVVACPEGRVGDVRDSIQTELLADLGDRLSCGLGFIPGGSTRQASVSRGLDELIRMAESRGMDPDQSIVLIHDAARPWVTPEIIRSVVSSAKANAACIPVCDLPDSPKTITARGFIAEHPERDLVKAAQTPQGFALGPLSAAHAAAEREGWSCTDDSSLWSRYLGPVAFVPGDRKNRRYLQRTWDPETPPSRANSGGEAANIHSPCPRQEALLGGVHANMAWAKPDTPTAMSFGTR